MEHSTGRAVTQETKFAIGV